LFIPLPPFSFSALILPYAPAKDKPGASGAVGKICQKYLLFPVKLTFLSDGAIMGVATEYRTRKQVRGLRKTVAVCSTVFLPGGSAEAAARA
jgi:hypothetical protein